MLNELRPWTWPWLIATTLSKAALATVICLGLWGALPAAIGWQPTTVSSGSMMPRLHVGDVAVSRPLGATPPSLGTVLLFDDPDHPGRLRLHRFIRVDDNGLLVTRGDANTGDDSSPISLAAVRGIGTLRVPWVGLPVVWVRERAWLSLAFGLVVLMALTAVAAQGRKFGFPQPEAEPPDDPETPGAAPEDPVNTAESPSQPDAQPARHPAGIARTAGAVALVALCLVPALPADAAFADKTAATNSLAAASYFRCANATIAHGAGVWYRMDETSSTTTTAADSSGNAQTGVYSSAGKTAGATRACSRDTGTAMTFNGTTGYLSSPLFNVPAPNTLSLAIWFKTTTVRGGKLIGLGNSQTGVSGIFDRHLYMTNAGKIIFGVYPGAIKTVASPNSYNNGAWHQAVGTLSTAGMRLYVDGDLVASDATVTTGEGASAIYLRVAYDNLDGWTSVPTSRFFAGTLDDAVAYTTALSAAQVDAQYEAGS